MEQETTLTVQDDNVVEMTYILTVDGEIADQGTLEYLQGHGNIIAGLEKGLEGAKVGETREVLVEAKDGYGEHDPKRVLPVNRNSFPEDFEFKLGEMLRIRDASGHVFQAIPVAVSEDTVELDLNHPMAGKDLNFKVTILSIYPATEDQIAAGSVRLGGCAGCHADCSDPTACG